MSILHKEFNLPNPLANNWALQSRLLTGILTLSSLLSPVSSSCIYLTVLISHFWIVCLLFFYGVLRKNHLLPSSRHILAPSQQLIRLVRSDFQFFSGVPLLSLTIRWGNNRLCNSTCLAFLTSPLNPVIATHRALSFVSTLSGLHMARFSFPFFQDL